MQVKLALVVALAVITGLVYHSLVHNAYENGKTEGAKSAWVDAEEQRKKEWAHDAEEQVIRQKENAKQAAKLAQAEAALTQKAALTHAKTIQDVTKDDAVVAKAEQLTEVPVQIDGSLNPELPSQAELLDALGDVIEAYQNVKADLAAQQADYDESVELRNQVVEQSRADHEAAYNQIDELKKQLNFYKQGFHAETKHGGFGHALKRIFTLGIAK